VRHTERQNESRKKEQIERANAQIAHLVFAGTQANAEKTKRAIFQPTLR